MPGFTVSPITHNGDDAWSPCALRLGSRARGALCEDDGPGDIIISTPPKCGTTWVQMICALLILQEPELPLPLGTLSPWIDMGDTQRSLASGNLVEWVHREPIDWDQPAADS